jgi:hypothetical protein
VIYLWTSVEKSIYQNLLKSYGLRPVVYELKSLGMKKIITIISKRVHYKLLTKLDCSITVDKISTVITAFAEPFLASRKLRRNTVNLSEINL